MWHITFCILFVLIISGLVIGKTISLQEKGNTPGTVLRTTTTTTTTTTSANIKGIFLWNKM
jgi:hypothetical protein